MSCEGEERSEPKPAWKRVNDFFECHGLHAPPVRLRDELVMWLLAYERSGHDLD